MHDATPAVADVRCRVDSIKPGMIEHIIIRKLESYCEDEQRAMCSMCEGRKGMQLYDLCAYEKASVYVCTCPCVT